MKKVTVQEIEQALERAPGSFSVQEIAAALGFPGDDELLRRIEREIDGDAAYFNDGKGQGRKRADFFNGMEFVITPDDWEISDGMLFPANRFAAFIPEEIFPSDVTLRFAEQEIGTREITAPLGQIFHYCLLLGSDQILDYLQAESEANDTLRTHAGSEVPVTLTVFDFNEFFRKHRFASGDALLCRIVDYTQGVFDVKYLSGAERSVQDRRKWIAAFEEGLQKVFDRFEDYLDIPEQLAWGFFYAPETVRNPLCSLDEFTSGSFRLEIRADGDHAVLKFRKTGDDGSDADSSVPDGVGISSGETGDFGAMLREIGSALAPVEVDSFILDCCYERNLNFDYFFAHAFGRGELKFADKGQEAVFMNYLEERFEELSENYNRADDEPKAGLRETILELVEDRLELFELAAAAGAEKLTRPEFKSLSEIAMQLREILGMLNNSGFTPDDAELDRLRETVETRADDQEKLIEILESHLQESNKDE